jgi:UDP-N-acetylglucosamine 2-epimerase
MIHIFLGTKAQLIKMAPVMQNLHDRGIAYNLIDSGQHVAITSDLIKQFGLGEADVSLRAGSENIRKITQAMLWSTCNLSRALLRPMKSFKTIFKNQKGVCLIHGDTLSTLISLLYARRCRLQVAHIESGLRSYHLLDPFPEEIIRLLAMHFSDILFTPSEWAYQNLCKMGYKNKTVNVGVNTGIEAVRFAVNHGTHEHLSKQAYVVVTIHRMETIYSRKRMKIIVDLVAKISQKHNVLFILHEPTRRQLFKMGMFSTLRRLSRVKMAPLSPYIEFVQLIAGADFVVTDGGSIQEECYFLNKPCMVMRAKTERIEGLGGNARLVKFEQQSIDCFLERYPSLHRRDIHEDFNPSDVIVDYLLPWA